MEIVNAAVKLEYKWLHLYLFNIFLCHIDLVFWDNSLCSEFSCHFVLFHRLHFRLASMAFISGTHRDVVSLLGLAWPKAGHVLPLTFTGPSYSSASEAISIFWMMSFTRQCCFSSRHDISFILQGKRKTKTKQSIHVTYWQTSFTLA